MANKKKSKTKSNKSLVNEQDFALDHNTDQDVIETEEQTLGINPWLVENIEEFWFLCCPQCLYKSKTSKAFQIHAIENHPLSTVLFETTPKVEKVSRSVQYSFDGDFSTCPSQNKKRRLQEISETEVLDKVETVIKTEKPDDIDSENKNDDYETAYNDNNEFDISYEESISGDLMGEFKNESQSDDDISSEFFIQGQDKTFATDFPSLTKRRTYQCKFCLIQYKYRRQLRKVPNEDAFECRSCIKSFSDNFGIGAPSRSTKARPGPSMDLVNVASNQFNGDTKLVSESDNIMVSTLYW